MPSKRRSRSRKEFWVTSQTHAYAWLIYFATMVIGSIWAVGDAVVPPALIEHYFPHINVIFGLVLVVAGVSGLLSVFIGSRVDHPTAFLKIEAFAAFLTGIVFGLFWLAIWNLSGYIVTQVVSLFVLSLGSFLRVIQILLIDLCRLGSWTSSR